MQKPPVSRESDKFMLRFPDGMRDRIRIEAEKNGRSMNAEIVSRLEASFDTERELSGLVAKLEGFRDKLQAFNDGMDATRSLAEDNASLQAEMESAKRDSGLSRLYVLLDSSGYPQSWAQIHEVARAICETGGLTAVEMSVTVVTPEMVSSSERYAEAAALATRLRALGRSGDIDQMESRAVNNRVTTSIPAKGSKPSSKRRA